VVVVEPDSGVETAIGERGGRGLEAPLHIVEQTRSGRVRTPRSMKPSLSQSPAAAS
jgi:hypothetical protein